MFMLLFICSSMTTNCIHGLNSHLQLTEKGQQNKEDDLDSRALEEGFVSDNSVFSTYPMLVFLGALVGTKHSILLC